MKHEEPWARSQEVHTPVLCQSVPVGSQGCQFLLYLSFPTVKMLELNQVIHNTLSFEYSIILGLILIPLNLIYLT